MKKIIAFSAVIAGAIFLSGCGQQSASKDTVSVPVAAPSNVQAPAAKPNTAATPAPEAKSTVSSIAIQNFSFSPANLTIKAGTTVTWTNNDSATHSIKSSSFASSQNLATGQTYQFQFNTPGTFNYSCGIHPMMVGTITVQ